MACTAATRILVIRSQSSISHPALVGTIDVSPYEAPHGLQVDANGTLYASATSAAGRRDRPERRAKSPPRSTRTAQVIGAAVLPAGRKAYVANKNDRRFVSVIDIPNLKIQTTIAMPNGTQGITASPDGKQVLALDLTEPRLR